MTRLQDIARACFHQHGFEYQVTISQVSDRALCAVTSIHFDRSSQEETLRAERCHDALIAQLAGAGYIPYRGHARTIERLRPYAPDTWAFARRLKQVIDPEQLIAPGRYIAATAQEPKADSPEIENGIRRTTAENIQTLPRAAAWS
ncbi:MAG: FAD-binding oxidoreductase [Deltaproteobacteria bacterium]|nr:FAD-binding oxidoreductase [Deltaproteobacteria bacterium]